MPPQTTPNPPPPLQTQPQSPPPAEPPPLPSLPSNVTLETDEQVLATVRRHLIGLVLIYLQAFAGVAAIIVLAIVVAPDFFNDLSGQAYTMLILASTLMLALLTFVLMLATSIYRQNKLVITNKGVIQNLQSGPFHKKQSRLSMADVEDVTSDQKGFLTHMFNYGDLHIESSGELKNFVFKYTPNPSHIADLILQARKKTKGGE